MSLTSTPAIFGSPRRTEVLVLLALLEESYPREIARILRAPLLSIQTIVDSLERQGILTTRLVGNQRRVTLNPRYYGVKQLKDFLLRLADGFPELQTTVSELRRRPRRRGKVI
jgi:DNA-binding transcriptional ArsR family regulator